MQVLALIGPRSGATWRFLDRAAQPVESRMWLPFASFSIVSQAEFVLYTGVSTHSAQTRCTISGLGGGTTAGPVTGRAGRMFEREIALLT